jgi:hypothetical protein
LLSDCIVSPNVFIPMVDRLAEFAVPYQHVLETEAGQRNVHLYLGYVRDTGNFVSQRGSSRKVSLLGQHIGTMFGL